MSKKTPPPHSVDNNDQAIGLTVYDLPGQESSKAHAATDTQRRRSGRIKMLILLLVCAAPIIASYLTYYVIRPEGRRNYGLLVQPQRGLPHTMVQNGLSGLDAPYDKNLQALKGQWLLLSVSGGACPAACEKHLYLQRQLRESMGREKARMDWVWIVDDTTVVPERIKAAAAQGTVLRASGNVMANWLKLDPADVHHDYLYVVDPMGNLMMRFPAEPDAKQVRKDLERLLRAASSWDREGREETTASEKANAQPK